MKRAPENTILLHLRTSHCTMDVKEREGARLDTFEKAYTTKEVSTYLNTSDSNLRKWCIALERNGYEFIRNDQKNDSGEKKKHSPRIFVEADLVVFQHYKQLVQEHNMPLNTAAAIVVDRFGKKSFESRTGIVPVATDSTERSVERAVEQSSIDILSVLEERFEMQEEFNKQLIKRLEERLEQQERYIEEKLKKRDEMLVQSLRETLDTKKMLLESKEEERDQLIKKAIEEALETKKLFAEAKEESSKKEAEREELIKQAITESQETRKMIAAANEEQKKQRKGFFARLFGRE